MAVYNGLAHTQACLESLRTTTEPFRLVVADNASSDGTPEFLKRFPYPYPLTVARSETNGNVIAALNRAWRLTDTEFVCLLHNDTEMVEPAWLSRLLGALAEPGAGLAGLYGAKRLRASGRLVGRTVVHSLLPHPTVKAPWEEVAFVDAVCLCISRSLLDAIGRLDEGYGFYHGIDRDLSLDNPVQAFRQVSRDLACRAPLRLRDGRTITAIDVQRELLECAHRYYRDRELDPVTKDVLARWEHVLDRLADDPMSLGRELDWVIKRHMLERYIERKGTGWNDPRVFMMDLQYHDIQRDRGLYYLLERAGAVERVFDDAAVDRAKTEPPPDTRARMRGEFIKLARENSIQYDLDWSNIRLGNLLNVRVICNNPFESDTEKVAELVRTIQKTNLRKTSLSKLVIQS